MKKPDFSAIIRNCKKNIWLLFSAAAALGLFLPQSRVSLVLAAALFGAAAAFDIIKPVAAPSRNMKTICVLLAAPVAYLGFDIFRKTWASSGKAAALAEALGVNTQVLLLIAGALGCVAGFYAMYVLTCWAVSLSAKLVKARLPVQDKGEIIENLKRNWYFPISAAAYFGLWFWRAVDYFIGLFIAVFFMTVIASQVKNIAETVKGKPWYFNLFLMASGAGICWHSQKHSYAMLKPFSIVQTLEAMAPFDVDVPMCISMAGAIAAFAFVFIALSFFWTALAKALVNLNSERSLTKGAAVVLVGLASILIIGSSAIFLLTDAFYGSEIGCDLVYTSDSGMLLKNDVYLSLIYEENDLRQPLFAVFAAPFIGLPYLICKLVNPVYSVQAIILNAVQIAVLIFANYLLAKMLRLSAGKTVCFMLFTCSSYSQLLSVLMMEQYIFAYFWLMLCLYTAVEKQRPDRIALWGAGGTLLTGMILLPLMSDRSAIKNFRQWLTDMVKYGMEFIWFMLLMGRFDVFYYLMPKISSLSNFTGKTITLADKTMQYLAFVRSCIFAPNAGVDTETFKHISWQLNAVTAVDFVGVFILILVAVSAFWNRDKKSSLLAAGWIGFSVIMLLGLGWGTKENGLILYTLYFGWAFLVLLFQLVEKIEAKLNIRFLTPVVTVAAVAALLMINIPAILEMVDFAITYYPV